MENAQESAPDDPLYPPLSHYRKNLAARKIPQKALNWFQGWGGENFRISTWVRSYGVLRPLWFPFFWKTDPGYLQGLQKSLTELVLPSLTPAVQLAAAQSWRVLTKTQYNYVMLLNRLLMALKDLDLGSEAPLRNIQAGPLRTLENLFSSLLTVPVQDLIKVLDRCLTGPRDTTGFSSSGRTALRVLLSLGEGPSLFRLLEGLNMLQTRRCLPFRDLFAEGLEVVSPFEFDLPAAFQSAYNETLVNLEKTLTFGFREERENAGLLEALSAASDPESSQVLEEFFRRGSGAADMENAFCILVQAFLRGLLEGYGIFLAGKNRDSITSPPEEIFDPGIFSKEVKDLLEQYGVWSGLCFSAGRVTPQRFKELLSGNGQKILPPEEAVMKEASKLTIGVLGLLKKLTGFWKGEVFDSLRDRPVFDPVTKGVGPLSDQILVLESALGTFLLWVAPDLVEQTLKKLKAARKDTQKAWSDFRRMGSPERIVLLEKDRPAGLEDK